MAQSTADIAYCHRMGHAGHVTGKSHGCGHRLFAELDRCSWTNPFDSSRISHVLSLAGLMAGLMATFALLDQFLPALK